MPSLLLLELFKYKNRNINRNRNKKHKCDLGLLVVGLELVELVAHRDDGLDRRKIVADGPAALVEALRNGRAYVAGALLLRALLVLVLRARLVREHLERAVGRSVPQSCEAAIYESSLDAVRRAAVRKLSSCNAGRAAVPMNSF